MAPNENGIKVSNICRINFRPLPSSRILLKGVCINASTINKIMPVGIRYRLFKITEMHPGPVWFFLFTAQEPRNCFYSVTFIMTVCHFLAFQFQVTRTVIFVHCDLLYRIYMAMKPCIRKCYLVVTSTAVLRSL